jgi:hypothetical protein
MPVHIVRKMLMSNEVILKASLSAKLLGTQDSLLSLRDAPRGNDIGILQIACDMREKFRRKVPKDVIVELASRESHLQISPLPRSKSAHHIVQERVSCSPLRVFEGLQ